LGERPDEFHTEDEGDLAPTLADLQRRATRREKAAKSSKKR